MNGTVMTRCPPGRNTRDASSRSRWGLSRCSSTSRASTASTAAVAIGRADASMTTSVWLVRAISPLMKVTIGTSAFTTGFKKEVPPPTSSTMLPGAHDRAHDRTHLRTHRRTRKRSGSMYNRHCRQTFRPIVGSRPGLDAGGYDVRGFDTLGCRSAHRSPISHRPPEWWREARAYSRSGRVLPSFGTGLHSPQYATRSEGRLVAPRNGARRNPHSPRPNWANRVVGRNTSGGCERSGRVRHRNASPLQKVQGSAQPNSATCGDDRGPAHCHSLPTHGPAHGATLPGLLA